MDKYQQAFGVARAIYKAPYTTDDQRDALAGVFPELRESEDERIRKFLVKLVSNDKENNYRGLYEDWKIDFDDVLAWLEKQKESKVVEFDHFREQKPAEWSEEDERIRLACIATINDVIDYERDRWEDYNPGKPYRPITKYDEQIDWLKSLKNKMI